MKDHRWNATSWFLFAFGFGDERFFSCTEAFGFGETSGEALGMEEAKLLLLRYLKN